MSRGKFILITISICIILGFGGYYLYKKYTSPNTGAVPGTKTGTDFSIFDSLLPGNNTPDTNNTQNPNNTQTSPQTTSSSRLHQISYRPVIGYGFFTKSVERIVSDPVDGKKPKTVIDIIPVVRYADMETGIIYEQDADHLEKRFSNTTIPYAHEALLSSDGTHVIYRFLDKDDRTILTFVGQLITNPTSSPMDITGNFVAQNIKEIKLTPDGLSYTYLRPKSIGVDVVTTPFATRKDKVLFSSPLAEWILDPSQNSITLTTKPSYRVMGYSYNIDLATNAYTKILTGLGLTEKTSSDNTYTLYNKSGSTDLVVNYNQSSKTYNTGLQTLPEKCLYANGMFYCAVPKSIDGGMPDAWYQGVDSFSDSLWKIDPKNQILTNLDLSNNVSVDATMLGISKDGQDLYFIDKKTSLLWAYDL